MNPEIGQVAALLTAACFSISSIFFTFAGRKFGAMVSNRLRLATPSLAKVGVTIKRGKTRLRGRYLAVSRVLGMPQQGEEAEPGME